MSLLLRRRGVLAAGGGGGPVDPVSAVSWHTVFDADRIVAAPWLDLPGSSGNYASVPDHNSLDVTGDLDLRVAVAMDDWTPAAQSTLIAKWGPANSYTMDVFSGNLRIIAVINGASRVFQVTAPAAADGELLLVRGTIDVDNGLAGADGKLWTKSSTPENAHADLASNTGWTQLGATQTIVGAAGTIAATTTQVSIGQQATSVPLAGRIFAAIIKDGIDGTTVLDADFTAQTPGATSFTDGTGTHTVTVNGTAKIAPVNGDGLRGWDSLGGTYRAAVQATGSKRPTYVAATPAVRFDGVDDVLRTAAFTARTQPNTIIILAKKTSAARGETFFDGRDGANRHLLDTAASNFRLHAGTTISGGTPSSSWAVLVALFNTTTSALYVNGGSAVLSGGVGSHSLTGLSLGANNADASPLDGDIQFLGLYAGNLRTADLAALNDVGQALADRVGATWTAIT